MSRAAAIFTAAFAVIAAGCFGTTNPVAGPTQQQQTASSSSAPAPTDCSTINVSGFPSSVTAAGGRRTFTIQAGSACEWTAASDASWATISPLTGIGTRTITMNVGQHTRFDTRSMTLTVNTRTFQMVQSGIDCTYAVRPTSLEAGGSGEATTIQVTATAGCGWTATASESWIRPVPASGVGSMALQLEIAANGGDARTAFATVAGIRVNVSQRAR